MNGELEAGGHREVPSAPAQRPEQFRFILGVRASDRAIDEHDVGRPQIVDGQSVDAAQPADPVPRVRPATPVLDTMPPVLATPCRCVAAS